MSQPKRFWRFSYDSDDAVNQMIQTGTLIAPKIGLRSVKYDPDIVIAEKIREGDGIFLARFDQIKTTGNIVAIGIAKNEKPTTLVIWKSITKQLHPNPQGGTEPWKARCFKFSGDPAKRYCLSSLFAEHFK
jgi:hypothetical protein